MQEWTKQEWEKIIKEKDTTAFYLYTPMCGTCMVASKIMEVVEHIVPNISIGKANMNYMESLAIEYKIESVPCLLISKHGKVVEKVYAFQSVQNIYGKLVK